MRTCSKAPRFVTVYLLALMGFAALPSAAQQRFECLVEPYVEVDVSSVLPGILEEVLVDRGDTVTKGQVLATLRSDLDKARLDLTKARAEFATRRAQRNQELYLKQMISPHEKDELETNARILELEQAELQLRIEMHTIRSPLDAVVVDREYAAGEFVREDPILKLAQVHPLRVEVAVPATLYGRIKPGMKAKVGWDTLPVDTRTATVTIVDPVVEAASGTIGVRLELPNASRSLPAGTQCWVRFPIN